MRSHAARFAAGLSAFLLPLLDPGPALAQLSLTGRWTGSTDPGATWHHQAVHMILTRGYGGPHSQILWYDGNHTASPGFQGGVWGWTPGSMTGDPEYTLYPNNHFDSLYVSEPPHNIFCTGHSAISDGRVLITGGTEGAETGVTTSALFSPSDLTWETTDDMSQRRWYPTTTTLPDGQALVSSGSGFIDMQIFGGREEDGDLASDSLQFFGLSVSGEWVPPRRPHVNDPWPAVRDAHSAVWNAEFTQWIIFGGRTAAGLPRDDAWMLIRGSDPDIEDAINATPIANGASQLKPAGRYRHSAVNFADDGIGPLDEVLVFGGRGSAGVFNDLWKLKKTSPPNQATVFEWSVFQASGAPTARQGHAAIRDPVNNRMLVFGGANASDQPIDFTLHALSLTGTPTWSTPTVEGTPPPARHGHTFVLDPLTLNMTHHKAPTAVHRRRVLVFGGQESSGGLSSGLWILWIPEPGTGENYQWQQVTPNVTTEGAPTGRYRLAADADKARFVIQGGDLGGGVATDETWGLDLIKLAWPGSETSAWDRLPPHPNKKLTGHTGLMKYLHWARHAERFSPATGNWETFANPKRQDSYPFHFVTPHTNPPRIFFAGPTEDSQYLVLASTPYWEPFPATRTPGYRSGSAVMFRPGEVMRCGSRDTDPSIGVTVTVGTTQRINLMSSPAPTAWTETQNMGIGRVNHSLVLLPTGGVLVTGGTSTINNQASANPVFTPQIWSPGTSTWTPLTGSTALASDNTIRGYHSNAILLPDGRVLTGSGATGTNPQAGLDSHKATIFSPPYLFSGNSLAVRPVITASADTIVWGHSFNLATPEAGSIASACLIRPAASTHGFNQDQRYVPLAIRVNQSGQELILDAPLNGSEAPPGDYMLFILSAGGVPSIAKWVWVRGQDESGACTNVTPSQIALSPGIGRTTLNLSWMAPGSNGACGTAQVYDLRESSAAITEANFYAASPVSVAVPTPGVAGTQHCIDIPNVTACTNYHFAIKARDAQGGWSKPDLMTVKTLCSTYTSVLCDGGGLSGGGGGQEGARGMALASAQPTSGTAAGDESDENSFLRAGTDVDEPDLRRLSRALENQGGRYSLSFQQEGSWRSILDELSLGVVDHDPALTAVAANDQVLLGAIGPVVAVTEGNGVEVPGLVEALAGEPFELRPEDALIVRLQPGRSASALVFDSRAASPRVGEELGGILVEEPAGDGGWSAITEIHPRRRFDRSAVLVGARETLRLRASRPCFVRLVAQMDVVDRVAPHFLTLVEADHSSFGATAEAVSGRGGALTSLVPGDRLELAFAATPLATGQSRDFFVLARGAYEPADAQDSGRLPGSEAAGIVPGSFALGPARPNPSSGATSIDFSLPRRLPVEVHLYDVAGRRMRTLVRGELPAGFHHAAWDGRDDSGRAVGSGVYFYRVVAGEWRSERKLIVLQN